jgi:hypothetical protein
MTYRATFTLEPDAFAFLKQMGGENRSGYINELLKREKRRTLEQAILSANREEAGDQSYQAELETWDVTLEDGLDE